MSRRKGKSKPDGLRGDEWLSTYADTITLLLTFFILLYSFSSINEQKLAEIATSLQMVLTGKSGDTILEYNNENGDSPIVGIKDADTPIPEKMNSEMLEMYNKVNEFIDSNKLQNTVEVKEDDRGIILQLKESILYQSGKADLREDSEEVLDVIAELLKTFPNKVIVEGHTDNVPMHSAEFDTNWELSAIRSVNVVRYFVEVKKITAERLSAAGYGEYKPIAENSSEQGRTKNRRVNILIIASLKEDK
ncbi:OmpA family protein [Alloiococcus sp. CFN-8]|uniref:OmpA family protein n=1 Tax=Alloiococcus sp. CFN-8 TaxID=3416081 RepID=UPI003CF22A61